MSKNARHARPREHRALLQLISIAMVGVIAVSTCMVLVLRGRSAIAYLYDENQVTVDYSVSRLAFDLSSDHMYTYYDTAGVEDVNGETAFEKVLTTLSALVTGFDSAENTMTTAEFGVAVKAALTKNETASDAVGYYSADLIQALQTAWNDGYDTPETYVELCRSVYNTYYHDYRFLFKIKGILPTSVEESKGIWYYYAQDLLNTYYGTDGYIIQNEATGVKQSTVRIGVKLKGGTTYNADTDLTRNPYYDTKFNDMVQPMTLKFKNTGDVSLYLNYILDMQPTDTNGDPLNAGCGVLGMVLPCGWDFATLQSNPTYSSYYDAEAATWNFRGLILALLSDYDATYHFTAAKTGTVAGNVLGTLTYDSLEALLAEWNAYAAASFYDQYAGTLSEKGNIMVDPNEERYTGLKELNTSLLFWADYGQNAENHDPDSTESWRVGEDYALYAYHFTLHALTSLKDAEDMQNRYTQADWDKLYNQKQEYDKFAGVSNFDVEGAAYFLQTTTDGGVTTYTQSDAINFIEGGYLICNYIDPTATNYIGKLHFDAHYRGYSPAYLRLRVIEQFTNTRGEIEAVNWIPFKPSEGWHDNRNNADENLRDLYFYSDELYWSSDTTTLTNRNMPRYLSVPILEGLDGVSTIGDIDPLLTTNTTMTLKLSLFLEAVQPNRTEEYWSRSTTDIHTICTQ